MKLLLSKLVLLVAFPLGLCEISVRISSYSSTPYERLVREPASTQRYAFFLGTSRTAAAIEERTAAEALRRTEGFTRKVLSMAQAGAYTPYHYLGLRLVAQSRPELLHDALVFIEAPEGVPEGISWKAAWPRQNLLLVGPLLDSGELLQLLASERPRAEKWSALLSAYSHLWRALSQWQSRFYYHGDKLMTRTILKARALVRPDVPVVADAGIREVGGIRVDDPGIRHLRAVLQAEYTEKMARLGQQKPIDWEGSVLAELVVLLQRSGARVIFFELPLSSYAAVNIRSTVGYTDREAFRKKAAEWSCARYRTSFNYGDDDFPDLSHLSAARASEFTTMVIEGASRKGALAPARLIGSEG